jgi:hypothetical protein
MNADKNRVEALEGQIKTLNAQELKAFRERFAEYDAEVWDRQFESDVQSGKLDELAARALQEHKTGQATEL